MSKLAILLARVWSISTILLKCLLNIFASFSLLLIVLLLLFKIMVSLWKAISKKKGPIGFQNFILPETKLWFRFPKNCLLVLWSKLTQKFLSSLKRLLDSSFQVFKNVFLSFDLFVTAFRSYLVYFFFFYFYFFFLECACQEQITHCH